MHTFDIKNTLEREESVNEYLRNFDKILDLRSLVVKLTVNKNKLQVAKCKWNYLYCDQQ